MPLPSNPVDALVQLIKNNIGRTNDSNVNDMVFAWINQGQKVLCNRNNFWFMHAVATHTWNQGQTTNALPADYKNFDNMFLSVSGTLGFTELDPMDLEDYRRRYDDTTQAQPDAYLIRETPTADYILRAVPDKTYTISFVYYNYLTDLVAGGAANLLVTDYPDILEKYGTARGFQYLQEFDDAKAWMGDFETSYRDLVASNCERELTDEFILHGRPDVKGTTVGVIRGRTNLVGTEL